MDYPTVVRRKSDKHVSIQIIGGIGNQLFAFMAGKYISSFLGVGLRVIQPSSKGGESNHLSSLSSLDTGYEVETLTTLPSVGLSLRFAANSLARRLRIPAQVRETISKIHISDKIGFDSELPSARNGFYITGYFQTYVYINSLRSRGLVPTLELKTPSEWFRVTAQEIRDSNPIVMHVRRGDYLLDKNSYIGVLSVEYYLSAMNLIRSKTMNNSSERGLWIFTDSPECVSQEFLGHLGENGKIVSPPEGSDPAESLILMSLASDIIISNSTFSWWAAALSRNSKVVAPSKWFRSQEDPERLIPDSWLRVDSQWRG